MTQRQKRYEVLKNERLSGHAYVVLALDLPDSTPGRVRLRQPQNCEHELTICADCAESWELDHVIYYDRTAGGRKLKARINAK